MSDDAVFSDQMRRIEQLVEAVESAADLQLRSKALELVQLLLDVHRAGFERVMSIAAHVGDASEKLLGKLADDPVVSNFLILYDLHPVAYETRLRQALDKVRPLLQSHGGDVELLSSDQGQVKLRLLGSCHGCPSSTQTLRNAVEAAIYECAPETRGLDVEGIADGSLSSKLVALSLTPSGT